MCLSDTSVWKKHHASDECFVIGSILIHWMQWLTTLSIVLWTVALLTRFTALLIVLNQRLSLYWIYPLDLFCKPCGASGSHFSSTNPSVWLGYCRWSETLRGSCCCSMFSSKELNKHSMWVQMKSPTRFRLPLLTFTERNLHMYDNLSVRVVFVGQEIMGECACVSPCPSP